MMYQISSDPPKSPLTRGTLKNLSPLNKGETKAFLAPLNKGGWGITYGTLREQTLNGKVLGRGLEYLEKVTIAELKNIL